MDFKSTRDLRDNLYRDMSTSRGAYPLHVTSLEDTPARVNAHSLAYKNANTCVYRLSLI